MNELPLRGVNWPAVMNWRLTPSWIVPAAREIDGRSGVIFFGIALCGIYRCNQHNPYFTAFGKRLIIFFVRNDSSIMKHTQPIFSFITLLQRDLKFIDKAMSIPQLFYLKPESIAHKYELTNYYKKIRNLPPKFAIKLVSDKNIYSQMLAALMSRQYPEFKEIKILNFNIDSFIKANSNRHFSLEIPADKVAPAFIDFIKETSMENVNKNIFDFKIKQ